MNHIVFITTYNRLALLKKTLISLWETLPPLTPIIVINDGSKKDTRDFLNAALDKKLIMNIIHNGVNMGITPSIDSVIYYINNFVRFYNADHGKNYNPFVSYIQDDMVFTRKDWPNHCIEKYREVKKIVDINFITGFPFSYHFDENNHPRIHKDINIYGCHIRESMSGQHMMAKLSTWKERIPIPTRRDGNIVRGHPHNGMGSCVDWWLIRDSKPSKTLVVENIAEYIGVKKSTWQVY